MRLNIPPDTPLELRRTLEELDRKIEAVVGQLNFNLKGRRITNAGAAVDPGDYVTMLDVGKIVDAKLGVRDRAAAKRTAATRAAASTGGGGSEGGGIAPPAPLVPLFDGSGIVAAYAAANPTQLANSCLDTGGTWDFMDGVVAALRAVDDRFGYNGKRGDVNDLSEDAISYYHGEYALMNYGSNSVYVIDIIGGHCGASPSPAWLDVTGQGGALGAWVPTR